MCNDGPHYYEYTTNYDDSSFYIISFLALDHLTLSLTLEYTDLCEDEDFCIHTNQHIDHDWDSNPQSSDPRSVALSKSAALSIGPHGFTYFTEN